LAAEEAAIKVGEHVFGVIDWHVKLAGTPFEFPGLFMPFGFRPMTATEFSDRLASEYPHLGTPGWTELVHVDTVVWSWAIMAVLLLLGYLASRTLSRVPQGGQTVTETVVSFAQNLVRSFIGHSVAPYLWYIGSVFLFILAANWLGILPWKLLGAGPLHDMHIPHYEAPTGDINTTAAFALLTFLAFYIFGFAHKGVGYLKHYFSPQWWLFPFLVIEDVAKPLSLALRLFSNVTAGHVIIGVLLLLAPWFIPMPLMGLEIFVGAVQAFIFAALSASYIGAAISHDH